MIITLTTDFGLADPYVGVMKGVILGIAPDVQIVDITHQVPSYDVIETAAVLSSAYQYFPPETVHIVVVDPGVGSPRRPIAAASDGHVFVAPDNGVLSFVLDKAAAVYHITNERLFRHPLSSTFHGRDIFAPVAAHLAQGTPITSVGARITDPARKPYPGPCVLRIDKFGNIITNLRPEDLRPGSSIRIGGVSISRLRQTFAEADPGELCAIVGSTGFIEIILNQGSAAETLKVASGAEIEVESGSAKQ